MTIGRGFMLAVRVCYVSGKIGLPVYNSFAAIVEYFHIS